ncbi:type II toxin-antitoxin system RelE/ParE family toxin, partial [Salmonella enterica]|nr:type II toxin-antitoxin system RelE/ParE family toxin [Salmonella enterica]
MTKKINIKDFRDAWLDDFFEFSTPHRKIPPDIHMTLSRKLDIINAATTC